MMGFYFNLFASHEVKTGADDFNQPIYAAPVNIPCMIASKRKMVRSATGQEVISESTLYTDVSVKPDDRITFDGVQMIVITSAPMRTLDGSILFYEVSL